MAKRIREVVQRKRRAGGGLNWAHELSKTHR
jgi:hypothetical protein